MGDRKWPFVLRVLFHPMLCVTHAPGVGPASETLCPQAPSWPGPSNVTVSARRLLSQDTHSPLTLHHLAPVSVLIALTSTRTYLFELFALPSCLLSPKYELLENRCYNSFHNSCVPKTMFVARTNE